MPAFFEMGHLGRNLTYLFIPFGVDLYPLFCKNLSKNSNFFLKEHFFSLSRQFYVPTIALLQPFIKRR